MNVFRKKAIVGLIIFMFGMVVWAGVEKPAVTFNAYHTPGEVNKILKDLAGSNPGITHLHKIAVSPGGNELNLLEVGPETGKKEKALPAIFVAADMEGTVPISMEAALYLCKLILEQPEVRQDRTWYILPTGNPDAAWNYFKKPMRMDSRNAKSYNDDMDDREDEDGPEDLDGNGIVTMMRVKDPEGVWIPLPGDPRLMKKADWAKGEKGMYKTYTEGIDNDDDGEINEDPVGGVNIGINFPHLFKFFTKTGGAGALSETETYNLVKFIYSHPEIAMAICFGETNFCMAPPRGGRKESADFTKIKLPAFIGKMMGVDTTRTYTMDEIMEYAKAFAPGGMTLTESMVASFLGLGAAANPQQDDLQFYTEISEQYKEFLKTNKMDAKRIDPAQDKDGSFEIWAYYHLGVPSFALDFWTLPALEDEKKGAEITPEKLETMTNEEFLAIGEEKLDSFLKTSGAPDNVNAKMVINMVKGGMMDTKKMAQMLRQAPKPKSKEGADPNEKALLSFSDKQLGGKGFVDWKPYKHPTLGEVEIGGPVPYVTNTPPASMLENLLKTQAPWVFELSKKLPRVKIAKTEVKSMGDGVYRVEAWIENTGYLPYPTSMGIRNEQITPVVVTLEGKNIKILEGLKRSMINEIKGNSAAKVNWLIYSDQPVQLKLAASAPSAWSDTKTITAGPGGAK